MSILFDPRDARCKSPFGAVTTFAAVDFTFYPRGHAVTGCTLLAHHEFSDRWTETELLPTTDEDGAPAFSGTFFAPSQPELIWYHFRLRWADGGESCYGKDGFQSWDKVTPWQLTVYDGRAKTPGWFGRGVTYQIFPDRFYRARTRSVDGLIGCRTLHEGAGTKRRSAGRRSAATTARTSSAATSRRHHGKSSTTSLSLHVTTLYLNPIFRPSYRFGTADYERSTRSSATSRTSAPSAAGKKSAASASCSTACSTTPAQKPLLQRHWLLPRARRGLETHISPYYLWYSFHPFPTDYDAWWGIKESARREQAERGLCQLHHQQARTPLSPLSHLPERERVAARCRRQAARRIYLRHHAVMRQDFPGAYLLGEVWEDSTTRSLLQAPPLPARRRSAT